MKLKKYDSPESVFAAYFDVEVSELDNCDFGGFDGCGDEIPSIVSDDLFGGIRVQKVWGFVDEDSVIHFWMDDSVDRKTLLQFFGHEIGHRSGKPDSDEHQEEMRAETYGSAAVKAYEFMLEVLGE